MASVTTASSTRWPGFGRSIRTSLTFINDALELPDGEIVLVTKLAGGQHATVLQLPASPCEIGPDTESKKPVKLPSFEEANC
jgi:hypothetical protein